MKSENPQLPQGSLNFYQQGWDSRKFQTFVLDLLHTELELPVLEGGTEVMRRVLGADLRAKEGASQDGVDVVAKLAGGQTWGIECKHWGKWDETKARTALEKAKKFRADHYVFAVACEVDAKVQDYFRSLPDWELWTGSRLTSLLSIRAPQERAAKVIGKHFGADAVRAVFPLHDDVLLSAEEYAARWQQEGRLFHHHTRLIARQKALDAAVEFVNTGTKKVLIIKARGGEGKSRLLAEIGRCADERMPEREIKFVNGNTRPDAPAPGMSAVEWSRAVIIQDDAHRLDNLRPDILDAAARHDGAKLIIATRPQAVEALRDQLRRAGMDATHIESRHLELPRLKPAEMRELAREVLTPAFHASASRLASWSGDSPLICVIGGGLINRGAMNFASVQSATEFHDEVFCRFEQENLDTCVCPPPLREDAGRLLRVTALLSPVKEEILFAGLEKQFGWRRLDAEDRLRYLKEAELVVATGAGLRVSPDLLADHLVYVASLERGQPGPLLLETLRCFGENMWPTLLANLSAAEWRSKQEHGQRSDITEPLWQKFCELWAAADVNVQQGMINHWRQFAFFQPERSLELADLVLALRDDEPPSYYMVRQALLPVLHTIARHYDAHRAAALERLWTLARQWPEKQPLPEGHGIMDVFTQDEGSSTVWQVIAGLVEIKPGWSQERSLEVLDWVDGLLQRPEERWLLETHHGFFSIVLSKAFAREAEATEEDGRAMYFRTWQLKPRDGAKLRERVLAIIRERLLPHSPMAGSNAVGVLDAGMRRIVRPSGDMSTGEQRTYERELEKWRPRRLECLALLEEISRRYDEPFLHYRINQRLRHYFQYEEDDKFLAAVKSARDKLASSLTFDVCRVVLGIPHSEFSETRRDRITKAADTSEWIRQRDQVFSAFTAVASERLLQQFPANTELENWVSDFSKCAVAFGFSNQNWHHLAGAIGKTNPDRAALLLTDFLRGQHLTLSRGLNAVLNALPLAQQVPWIHRLLDSALPDMFSEVLWKLVWSNHDSLPEGVWQKVQQIAAKGSRERQKQIAAFVGNMIEIDDFGLELLAELPVHALLPEPIQGIVSRLGHVPGHTLTTVPLPVWSKLCDAIVEVPDLREDHWQSFLMRLNENQPRLAYQLYRRRIVRWEQLVAHDQTAAYSPLPWQFDMWMLGGLEKETDFPTIADDLMQRSLPDTEGAYPWKKLFWVAVVKSSGIGASLIMQHLAAATAPEDISAIISLIARQGSAFIYRHPEFVKSILTSLPRFSVMDSGDIRARLIATGRPGGWGASNGELDPEFGYALEEARRAQAFSGNDPLLSAFYREIISDEEELRETLRRRFQERA